jgi:hypothetical protein
MIGLVNNKLERMWKEATKAKFEGNILQFASGTEENHVTPQRG